MNEEFEELKDKIKGFLLRKQLAIESQYFLLLSLTEDIKDEIINEDDEELEEDEPEEEDDFAEEPEEEPEEEEDLDDDKPVKLEDVKKGLGRPPTENKNDHNLKLKKLLKDKK